MKQSKIICSLLFSLITVPSQALPDIPKQKEEAVQEGPRNPCLEKMVDEALAAIRKEAPFVHEDALRIWKNFKKGSPPPQLYLPLLGY